MSRRNLTLALLLAFTRAIALCETGPAAADAPNFVVILAEAQGWANTSARMDESVPASRSEYFTTPGVERLAREGMRFSRGYAASPRCTPSRAALLTGRSPAALHMTYVGGGREDESGRTLVPPTAILELPAAETTIAELLQTRGYTTAHFGKWHLGKVTPMKHGFDESDGANGNGGPENVRSPNPKQAEAITDQGVAFMKKCAETGRPFYLQISHYPNQEKKGGDRRTAARELSDTVDATLVRLLNAMDELDLTRRTYVFYTADHGSQGRNGNDPLSGGKGWLTEGGLRVPFIMRGPGVPAGVCSPVPATAMDLLPTFAGLAGAKVPADVEGGDLSSVLHAADGAGEVRRARSELVFHFPHYDLGNDGPASALILGNLKLVRNYVAGSLSLYDLATDAAESHDLSARRAKETATMDAKLSDYLKAVDAQMPRPVPPSAPKP